jgi:hypothetical protein
MSLAHGFSSRSRVPENAGASPSALLVEKELGKTAGGMHRVFNSVEKTPEQVEETRRRLKEQSETVIPKYARAH